MALNLDISRPVLTAVNSISPSAAIGTVIETDTAEEESFYIPIVLQNIDPPSFTVSSCTTTNGSTTVTATSGAFNTAGVHQKGVRPGDVVTGTGIPSDTTVVSVASNGNSLVLSQAATASGTVTLTFDPPNMASVGLYAIKVKHTKSVGSPIVRVDLSLHKYDGTIGGTAPTETNASSVTILQAGTGNTQIDIDAVLTALRVPRTNPA